MPALAPPPTRSSTRSPRRSRTACCRMPSDRRCTPWRSGHEQQHAADLAPFYPLLAAHWGRAGVADRAIHYSEIAGHDALGSVSRTRKPFASSKRRWRSTRAQARRRQTSVPCCSPRVSGADARRTQWRRCLGEAYVNLGMWSEGCEQLDRALASLAIRCPRREPRGPRGWWNKWRRRPHWLWRRGPYARSAQADALSSTRSARFSASSTCRTATDRKLPLFYGVLSALNLARAAPAVSGTGRALRLGGEHLGPHPYSSPRPDCTHWTATARPAAGPIARRTRSCSPGRASIAWRLATGPRATTSSARWRCRTRSAIRLKSGGERQAIRARAAHLRAEYELSVRLGAEIRARSVASGTAVHEIWGIDAKPGASSISASTRKRWNGRVLGLARSGPGDRVPFLDLLGASALGHLYRGSFADARTARRSPHPRAGTRRPGQGISRCSA